MGSRVLAIIRKEFIQIRRDPRTLAIVLALPVMQLLIFGYAINTVVDHLPTIVFDESQNVESRALLAAFHNSGYFDIVTQALSQAEVVTAIDAGQAKVGLLIPPDFDNQILRGQAGPAQLLVDGSDPNVAQTALFAAGMVAQVRSGVITADAVERLGRTRPLGGVDLRPIVLYNPSMLSVNFMIPGIIGVILQFQTLMLTAFAIVRERERGTLEQLVVTPIRPWELMLGKLAPYTVTAFTAASVALIVGRWLFGVEVFGSLLLLAALSLVFLIGSLGLGLLISTVSQTQAQALQMAMFILLPTLLLSGFLFPREGMPFVIQKLSLLIPLTYYVQILRGIMLKGIGLDLLWSNTWPLALFGLVVFTLSARRFQKRLG